jgi:ribose transport system substrate-binding protein
VKKVQMVSAAALLSISLLVAACGNNASQSSGGSTAAASQPAATAVATAAATPATAAATTDAAQSATEVTVGAPEGKVLSTGPHGEPAVSANTLKLTAEEVQKIRDGKYKAAIVFHYLGNDWSSSQLLGLQDTFKTLGIEVVAVTDAQFKAEKQVSDLESVLSKKPDIVVSIPVDATATSAAFKAAAKAGVKLVFMDNVPANMQHGEYVSDVSADNYGNGVIAGQLMGEKLGGKGKVGVVFNDNDYFTTTQRTQAFEQTIKEQYPGIEIVARVGFTNPNDGEKVASAMLTAHPEINGIFGVWDVPAEGILAAIRSAGRKDIVISTIDLGANVAVNIAQNGLIIGLGAQLPYHQGVAEAILGAYSLLGKQTPPYVALPPLKVTRDNLLDAWKTVYRQDAPKEIQDAMKK